MQENDLISNETTISENMQKQNSQDQNTGAQMKDEYMYMRGCTLIKNGFTFLNSSWQNGRWYVRVVSKFLFFDNQLHQHYKNSSDLNDFLAPSISLE